MRNPWIAVMRAGALGTGLHLSADEVEHLSRDEAIEACAMNDIDRAGGPPPRDWALVDPHKYPGKVV